MKSTIHTFCALSLTALAALQAAEPRERTRFNSDWRFARFGLQPDGTSLAEPGKEGKSTITITASSFENAGADRHHPAEDAMDGNPATRWCASDAAPHQWIKLDFQQPTDIGGVTIDWDITNRWTSPGLPYTFVIEGSQDGTTWKALSDNAAVSDRNPAVARISGSFRSLRVRTTAVKGGEWASIREIHLTDAAGKPVIRKPLPSGMPPSDPAFNITSWRALDLPHDWGVEGPFRMDLPGETGKLPWKGIGWYRKDVPIRADDKGRQIHLDFDGAMAHAKVYCNGTFAGTWPYGYSSFRIDLTPHLKFGATNTIAVRLDTENWDSRWYPGAGIYRNVWLVKTQAVRVAHWGTYATTPEITPEKGTLNLAVTLDNANPTATDAKVETTIHPLAADGTAGAEVARCNALTISIAAKGNATATSRADVPNPKLWDIHSPHRYIARTKVSVNGEITDLYDTRFGFRTLKFTARDGFHLNGRRVPILGVCMHHDLGALGAAINERALERQLEILIEMGCNSIRTSHNPPAPELLELCDRMGLLVWDEAFDCWKRGKKPRDYGLLYDEWHERDLRALIRRDRNHPCVFIWSIGNEVNEQNNVAMTKHLADIMRSEDPTRPVSNGYNHPDAGRDSLAALGIDLMGTNYNLGSYQRFFNHQKFAALPMIGSETSSCVSSRGEYFFPVKRGKDAQKNWHISSYDVDGPGWACTPDEQFKFLDRFPAVLGEYVWTGFDYLGEPTPYNAAPSVLLNFHNDPSKRAEYERAMEEMKKNHPPSRSSYFGIIDLAGFPKDRYYSYQARWRPDFPMAHILPHWNWPDRIDQNTPVHVYTSGDSGELFLNGKSLGVRAKKTGEIHRLQWDEVTYEPGELKVVVTKNGKPWATRTMKTTGPAEKLALSADHSVVRNDGTDLSFITVRIADSAGSTVPRSANPVKFTIQGPGEILAVDNGDPTSFEPFQASERKAFNGLALAIVRAKAGESGTITLTANSTGLKPATIAITSR